MVKVLEEQYMHNNILQRIKCIYGFVQEARCWFKEYINNTNLKRGFKQCKTDPYIWYRVNNLGTDIAIVYVHYMLETGDKLELMETIECINK